MSKWSLALGATPSSRRKTIFKMPVPYEFSPRKNRLLSRLSPEDLSWLEPQLTLTSLSRLEHIYEQHQPIRSIYFPITCVASVVQVMRDGKIIEAATIGNEGATGAVAILGADLSTGQVTAEV